MSMEKYSYPQKGFNSNSTIVLTEKNQNGGEDEYNPFEHRDMKYAHSTLESFAHLVKSVLGTGILAMPIAFKNSGFLFGAIGTIAISYLCTHCAHILVKTSQNVCKKAKIPSLDFGGTAEKVFELGPVATRKYSKIAGACVSYGIVWAIIGTCAIYIVFMGTTLHDMANYKLNIHLDVRWYIAAVLLPCICIGEIRHLKYLVPFSAFGNVCIIITVLISFYYMFTAPLDISELLAVASWKQIPLFISTIFFAVDGICIMLPIENTMKSPQNFLGCSGVLNTTITIITILYAAFGFCGYARYGDDTKDSITMNLPDGTVATQVAQILIGFTVLFSFGIRFFIPADIVWHKFASNISKEKHNLGQILFRAVGVLVLGAFALAIPKLEPFIGLIGGIFVPLLGLIVPAVLEIVFLYPNNFGAGNWILHKNILIVIASILTLLICTFASILKITDIYSS